MNKLIIFSFLVLFSTLVSSQTFIRPPSLIEGLTAVTKAAGTTTLTSASQTQIILTGTSAQTVVLPDATTLDIGRKFYIVNSGSTGTVTVNANGGGAITTVLGTAAKVILLQAKGSAAGTWVIEGTIPASSITGLIDLTSQVTGILPVVNGGTGQSSFGAGIIHSNGTILSSSTVSLTADVSGVLPIANGGTNKALTLSAGGIPYFDSDSFEVLAAGSAGQIPMSAGAGALIWTTATYPATAGTSGKILISDGTNIISSTPTYPNSATGTGKFLKANGTNWVASTATLPDTATGTGQFLRADGTNWVASTATLPATATSTGKILRADGTNWVGSTATYPDTATSTGTILRADGTNWSATTATYPTTTTANQILYSSATSVIGGLATAANGVLVTDGSSIPSIGSSLPSAVQGNITSLGTIASVINVSNSTDTTSGATGAVVVTGGVGVAKSIFSGALITSTTGVKFKNTGSGSDTNTWYEAGNWSPTVVFSGGNGTASITCLGCRFRRTNDEVSLYGRVQITKGSGSGTVTLGNLPYNGITITSVQQGLGLTDTSSFTYPVGSTVLIAYVQSNATAITLGYNSSVGGSNVDLNATTMGTTVQFLLNGGAYLTQ